MFGERLLPLSPETDGINKLGLFKNTSLLVPFTLTVATLVVGYGGEVIDVSFELFTSSENKLFMLKPITGRLGTCGGG